MQISNCNSTEWSPICNGNWTEWSPIRFVIIRVINKIGRPRSGSPICLITGMITDRIGRHEVSLPINHNFNKICEKKALFLSAHKKFKVFLLAVKKQCTMRTVPLNCPIKAEIRTVDSQSDLRILLQL